MLENGLKIVSFKNKTIPLSGWLCLRNRFNFFSMLESGLKIVSFKNKAIPLSFVLLVLRHCLFTLSTYGGIHVCVQDFWLSWLRASLLMSVWGVECTLETSLCNRQASPFLVNPTSVSVSATPEFQDHWWRLGSTSSVYRCCAAGPHLNHYIYSSVCRFFIPLLLGTKWMLVGEMV